MYVPFLSSYGKGEAVSVVRRHSLVVHAMEGVTES